MSKTNQNDTLVIDKTLEHIILHAKWNSYKGKALVISCVGISIFLILVSLALLFNTMKDSETTVKNSFISYSLPEDDRMSVLEVVDDQENKLDSNQEIFTSFTVFKTVIYKNNEIVTGWNFRSSRSKVPTDEYCYISKSSSNTTVQTFQFAKKTYGESISFFSIEDAKRNGYDNKDYEIIKNQCIWFVDGESNE